MMISLTDLLMTINTLFIVGLCIHYFKNNYKIMDMETYNQVCDICEEYTAMVQESEEQVGGEGFFREYLEEEPEEDDEDLEEEEDSVHSEPKVHPEPDKKEKTPKKKRGKKEKKVGF